MQFVKDHALGLILFILFLASWIFQFLTDPEGHFLNATFENWQSEFLQLFAFVVLAKYFVYRGSPQSRDGDDEMRKILKDIQRRLPG